jgi:hypothetical protein
MRYGNQYILILMKHYFDAQYFINHVSSISCMTIKKLHLIRNISS